jgi:saccharopine dehydrogenase-like NADP-dependent oxidoreductase
MGHDESHSLAADIPTRRIEFWMGFGERYLNCFNVLKELGLPSNQPVEVDGVEMASIEVVKAVLPKPASLPGSWYCVRSPSVSS